MSSVVYMVPMGFLAVSQYLTKHLKVMGFLMAGVVRRANVYHLPVQHRAVHFAQVVSALAESVSPNGTKDNLQCNMYCHVHLPKGSPANMRMFLISLLGTSRLERQIDKA